MKRLGICIIFLISNSLFFTNDSRANDFITTMVKPGLESLVPKGAALPSLAKRLLTSEVLPNVIPASAVGFTGDQLARGHSLDNVLFTKVPSDAFFSHFSFGFMMPPSKLVPRSVDSMVKDTAEGIELYLLQLEEAGADEEALAVALLRAYGSILDVATYVWNNSGREIFNYNFFETLYFVVSILEKVSNPDNAALTETNFRFSTMAFIKEYMDSEWEDNKYLFDSLLTASLEFLQRLEVTVQRFYPAFTIMNFYQRDDIMRYFGLENGLKYDERYYQKQVLEMVNMIQKIAKNVGDDREIKDPEKWLLGLERVWSAETPNESDWPMDPGYVRDYKADAGSSVGDYD